MEKRTCKLCFKTFSNGRALGGHMRSHMLKLQANPLPPPPPPASPPSHLFRQLEYHTESASYGYSSEEEDKGIGYELRENPRKSFRLVDPEFASLDAGSVVQDRESESESSRNLSGRRSKRSRKTGLIELPTHLRNQKLNSIEQEPVSSVSDTTPEEDVAWSLMLLSRGITGKEVEEDEEDDEDEEEQVQLQEDEDEEKSSEDELEEAKLPVKRSRGKFQCGTCKKFFRSYQALGGHRASHKKMKGCNSTTLPPSPDHNQEGNVVPATPPPTSTNVNDPRRSHECPVCFRVFSSGQALGGHKRSHLTGSASAPPPPPVRAANADAGRLVNNLNLIDLNLPAPMDDDEEEHFELSAVSDGEFNKFP